MHLVTYDEVRTLWTKAGGGFPWVKPYEHADIAMYASKLQGTATLTAAHYATKDVYGLSWGLQGQEGRQLLPAGPGRNREG